MHIELNKLEFASDSLLNVTCCSYNNEELINVMVCIYDRPMIPTIWGVLRGIKITLHRTLKTTSAKDCHMHRMRV